MFAYDTILYIENPKYVTRKILQLIKEFTKVAWYKINIQKSVAFLYTNNELSKREIKETISFTITSKRIQYLRINLLYEIKGLCSENYRTLMKEIEYGTNRWKDMFLIGRISIVKMTMLTKAICRFNAIPIKIPMAFFILAALGLRLLHVGFL